MLTPFYESKINLSDIKLDLTERVSLKRNFELELSLVRRLSKFFRLMINEQQKVDAVWRPAGEWKNYNEEKSFFYHALLNEDHEESAKVLRNFWRNKLGLIVKEYATYDSLMSGEADKIDPFLRSVLRNYIIWKDIYELPVSRLSLDDYVGNPWGCVIEDVMVTPKAIRFHHNAMQLRNLLRACNGNTIGEIGAGYGALCYYLVKEIPGVKYIDFDLPETLVLAAYNLLSMFPNKKIFLYGEAELNSDSIQEFDIALLPNYAITRFKEKSIDVFFNSFSLSEMAPAANAGYIKEISRLTRYYFLHNNMDRQGVVNRGSERIPASKYPISENEFVLLNKNYDLFHSHIGDYKEFLYKVL